MENKFLELYSNITKESFNTFIDLKNNLLLHQPSYLIKENKWQIIPNTNEGLYKPFVYVCVVAALLFLELIVPNFQSEFSNIPEFHTA